MVPDLIWGRSAGAQAIAVTKVPASIMASAVGLAHTDVGSRLSKSGQLTPAGYCGLSSVEEDKTYEDV
jgi:hypothetical protein